MKILQIVSQYPPGESYGVARQVEGLSRALAALGHDLHVVALSGSDTEMELHHGVKVRGISRTYPFVAYSDVLETVLQNMSLCEEVVRVAESVGPFDALMVHDWRCGIAASLAKRVFDVPLVAFLHGTQVGRMGGKGSLEEIYVADMERWLCERADMVIVPSSFSRTEVEKSYLVPREKILVVPNGVDPGLLAAQVDREDFRSLFAEPDEALLLFVGRLQPEKGPDLFLETAKAVSEVRPRTRFVLAGNGPMLDSLARRIEQLGLSGRVRLTGYLGPVVLGALHQVADLLVVPSRYEAAGISVLEAALHRLPAICFSVGGLPELAGDLASERLRLVAGQEPGPLALAVIDALAQFAPAIRQGAEKDDIQLPLKYRWPSAARNLEKIFGTVLVGASR